MSKIDRRDIFEQQSGDVGCCSKCGRSIDNGYVIPLIDGIFYRTDNPVYHADCAPARATEPVDRSE